MDSDTPSMGIAFYFAASAANQKVKICPFVGLQDSVAIKFVVTAVHMRLRWRPIFKAARQFVIRNIQMNPPPGDIDFDHVAEGGEAFGSQGFGG